MEVGVYHHRINRFYLGRSWLMYYEIPAKHKKLLKPEFDYIHSDVEDKADEARKKRRYPGYGY